MSTRKRFTLSKMGLLSACIAAALSAQAQDEVPEEEIVITGYRGTLQTSTNAKRDSVGFSDEIFSDDIGKMPSQNLAESLNRIPGVKINREITGEGQQISVRGLGPSFTKITLNGNSMSVASTGSLDSGDRGRQLDLDFFPPELFRSLSVDKTSKAHQQEGGVSGYVDMRTLRPMDKEGQNISFSLEGAYGELSEKTSPRYSAIYSWSDDTFGILAGIAGAQNKSRVDGYEAVALFTDGCVAQWTNEDPGVLDASSCVDGSQGLNHFFWSPEATPDYAAANGVAVGSPVDIEASSGVPADVLDLAKVPYLGRPMTTVGDRDRVTGLLAVQFRPNDDIEMGVDIMVTDGQTEFVRTEAMWWGRRNYLHQGAAMIPENVTVTNYTNSDGEQSPYITGGTFYNAHLWAGSRDYKEDLSFTSIMPSLGWQFTDNFRMDLSASKTDSDFDRDEPYVLYMSPGARMDFSVDGTVPSFDLSVDPSRSDIGWTWQQEFDQDQDGIIQQDERFGDMFRLQRNKRETETSGFHADFALGDDVERNGIKFGFSWDEIKSSTKSFGNGDFTNDNIIGSDPYNNFSDYLGPSIVSDLGSNIDGYHGYTGIAQVDWARIKAATNYGSVQFTENAGDQFGSTNGDISEEMTALYVEGNVESDVAGNPLRMNAGLRWVNTQQKVSSLSSPDGVEEDYNKVLPSLSAVYDVAEDVKLRASTSKSLTRANPSNMFPNAGWGSSGIDSVNAGNPRLSPFESTNFDIGGEWYFDDIGYVGLTYFEKEITGFTRTDTFVVTFEDLPTDWGLDISDLGPDREQALIECGGPATCTTNVRAASNVDGAATLTGWEAIWVMPLDMWVEGLGFNTSATTIHQTATDDDAIITGISDWTYNVTAYYENELFQTRLTYFHQDGSVAGYTQNRELISFDRSQVDFSASYALPVLEEMDLTLTFDAYNLTNEPVGSWHEIDGIAFNAFYPGATYTFGIRGRF